MKTKTRVKEVTKHKWSVGVVYLNMHFRNMFTIVIDFIYKYRLKALKYSMQDFE